MGFDVHSRIGRDLVWVRDTSEVLDFSSPSFLVKTFNISAFTNFKRGADVTLIERNSHLLVNVLSKVSVFDIWRDKGNKAHLSRESKQLGNF